MTSERTQAAAVGVKTTVAVTLRLLLLLLSCHVVGSEPVRSHQPPPAQSPPRHLLFHVAEGVPPGTVVGRLPSSAAPTGGGASGEFPSSSFTLLSQHVDLEQQQQPGGETGGASGRLELFEVDSKSGELRTVGELDRESLCPGRWASTSGCDVRLDVAVSPSFVVLRVVVAVDDVNDNAPAFRDRKVTRHVFESAAVGESLFQLPAAVDADSDAASGVIGYRLEPETSPFGLRIGGSGVGNADLSVELLKPLDRELTDHYLMTLTAYDSGPPSLSGTMQVEVIVADVNDNSPRFNVTTDSGGDVGGGGGYEVTLSPTAPAGTPVVTVFADDPDLGDNGVVRYRFAARTQSRFGRLFSINAETGEIVTTTTSSASGGRIDFGPTSTITLVVLAEDRGENPVPTSVTVTVRAAETNEHAPAIRVDTLVPGGRTVIAENSPPGSFIAHVVVSDADPGPGGQVECDIGDGQPEPEVGSEDDDDVGGRGERVSRNFDLVPLYGSEYKLVARVSFDRESRDRYEISLRCRDFGRPSMTSSARVIVMVTDVDDNAPKFDADSYNFTVVENNARGQTIGSVVARDADWPGPNGVITYQLDPEAAATDDDVSAWFSVDPTSGRLAARVPFDREFVDRFEFDVLATSGGGSSGGRTGSGQPAVARTRVRVSVLDADDEPPRFVRSWYRFDVSENLSAGTEVGRVVAVDEDLPPFDAFLYHLESTSGDEKTMSAAPGSGGHFAVDPVSGVIYTRQTLDRETLSHYTLRVRAQSVVTSQSGAAPLSDVTVVFVRVTDVNDNAPEVTYPTPADNTVHVRRQPADFRSGATVAVVTAHDRDAGANASLTYSIVAGNDGHRFAIERETGVISWTSGVTDENDEEERGSGNGRNRTASRSRSATAASMDCSWALTVQVKDGAPVNPLSTSARLNIIVDGCRTPPGGSRVAPEVAFRLSVQSPDAASGRSPAVSGLTDWNLFVVVLVVAGCIVGVGALMTIVITLRQCSRRRRRLRRQGDKFASTGGPNNDADLCPVGLGPAGGTGGDVQLRLLKNDPRVASSACSTTSKYMPPSPTVGAAGGRDETVCGGSMSSGGTGSLGGVGGTTSSGHCSVVNTDRLLQLIDQHKLDGRDIADLILALRQAQLQSHYQDSRLHLPRDRDTDSGCGDLSPVL